MSFMFSSPSTPDVPVLPVVPSKSDTSVQDAAKAMAESLRKKKGLLSTIVTGPEGLSANAPSQKAELLSGSGGYA